MGEPETHERREHPQTDGQFKAAEDAAFRAARAIEGAAGLLPLDAPERVAAFRSGGRAYRHVFRRLTADDWQGFFSRIEAEFSQQGRQIEQLVDTDAAALWLYSHAVVRAEGYQVRDGRKLEELPGWQERVPQHHRLAVIDLLTKVNRSGADGAAVIEPEGEVVQLDALWNEAEPGAMEQYRGLVHRFQTPTAEQRRRYLRAKNRSIVVGGTRSGRTILASAQPALARLYDELIEAVEGYAVGGRPIAGREAIAREMDGFHKVAAAGQLFPSALVPDEEQE